MKEKKKEAASKSSSDDVSKNSMSRRDFLKFGVGAAAVAAGSSTLLGKIPLPASESSRTPPANTSKEPIVAAVDGDQLTVMNGQVSVKVTDPKLAALIAEKLSEA